MPDTYGAEQPNTFCMFMIWRAWFSKPLIGRFVEWMVVMHGSAYCLLVMRSKVQKRFGLRIGDLV
jgi:hypothetical protein